MVVNKVAVAIGASSLASLVVGSFSGYLVAKRRLKRTYEEIAQQEIAEARRKLKMVYKKDEFANPASLVDSDEESEDHLPAFDEAVTAMLKQYDPSQQFARPDDHNPGTNGHQPLAMDIPQTRNVFEEQEMAAYNEDTEEQPPVGSREPGRPYIIDFNTFDAGEMGYRNITLTSYADGALVEEGDMNEDLNIAEDLIGEESLQYMGWERGQPNVVYVRNDRLRVDYEVIRDERRFAQDMLGLRDDSPLVQQIQELRRPRSTPNEGPRSRFANRNPGGVVRAAGE